MGLPTKIKLHFGDEVTTVKLLTAVDKEGSGLKMVCNADHEPASVKMPAVCTSCGKSGNIYSFPRAREIDGKLVVVTAEELAETRGTPIKEIVVTAHPLGEVLENTFPGESQYLMVPSDANSVEIYTLIRQALADNPNVALLTQFAVSTSNKMWRIGVFENGLSLSELAWPEHVKARPMIARVNVIDELRAVADEWMAVNTVTFDPLAYRDMTKVAREELLAGKVASASPVAADAATVSTSLLDRLRASVEAAKASAAPVPAKAPRKRAAKKAVSLVKSA